MPKTNFFTKAMIAIAFLFSLASCMEKIGDEISESMTFVKGDYLLTPKVEIEVEKIKEIIHDTLYYKVVIMDSIFIHDTLPPRYIYDTVEVEVPVPYPVHDTVIVVQRDTVWQTIIEERIDTLYLRDTIDKSFSGVLLGRVYVAGKNKAAVQQYTLDKGEIVNQELLYGSVDVSLSSGKTEVKKEATLHSTTPNITDNTFSFDVTDGVGGANVSNVWGYEYNAVAKFDGFTETIDAEFTIESVDFYQRSDLEWRHIVTASLDGIPQATATWEFWKEEEVVVPVPDPVWGVEFADEAWPISATTQQTYAYPTKDGVRTGEEVKVYAPIHGNITASETIYKTSNGTVELASTSAEVSGENAKFTYNLEDKFNDNWKISVSKEGTFTYEGHGITKTATIPLKAETSVKSVSFNNNNGTYSNKATLFLDSFAIGSDVQIIIVEKPEPARGVEKEGPFFSDDMRGATMKFFPTVNGERTGTVVQKRINLEYTFTPGAALEFNSNETPSIKDANAVIIGNEAFIPHTLGSTEFNATFTYGGTIRGTFSYSDEYVSDEVTVDLNISYDVKATGAIEQSGTSYSTPAALYANGVEVENEKFVFSVKPVEPTYPGYRVYNAGQWAITRIYNQNASQSLVVLVGTLEHIQTGKIYAIHQVLEGSAGNLPKDEPQEVGAPTFAEPYSMFYNVATSAWEYGSIVGAKKGTVNLKWMYFNWGWSNNQIVSENTSTDLLDDVVLYQIGSEDNSASEAGTISLTYNGQTITVVSDKQSSSPKALAAGK